MRKTLISLAFACVMLTGCDWSAVESGAEKVKSAGESAGAVVAQAEQLVPAISGLTAVVLGLTSIASGVAAFAARRKTAKVAAAASAAAEAVGKGGGTALVNAASVLGVAADIANAYAKIKATTVSSK